MRIAIPKGKARGFSMIIFPVVLAWLLVNSMPSNFDIGGGGWWICLEYVGEGTLYGGQPYCAQGPVIYYLGYFIGSLTGTLYSEGPLMILSMASAIMGYLVLRAILIKQGLYNPWVYAIAYVLAVFRLSAHTTSMVAMMFFLIGYYQTTKPRNSRSALLAGAAFTLGIFTKYTALLPTIIVVAYSYIIRDALVFSRGKIKFNPAAVSLRWPALIGGTAVLAFIGFSMAYPNFIEYTIGAQRDLLKKTVFEGIVDLILQADRRTISAAAMLSLSGIAIHRGYFSRETLVYPLALTTFIAYGIMFSLTDFMGGANVGSPYLLPAYPMLVGTLMAVYRRNTALFCAITLIVLVYPSIFANPLVDPFGLKFLEDREAAINRIQYGMHYLPKDPSSILVEGPGGYDEEFISKYDLSIRPERMELINSDNVRASYTDPVWTPKLKERVGVDYEGEAIVGDTIKEDVMEEILSGGYDIIITGPPAWAITGEALRGVEEYVKRNYCGVYLPNFQYMGEGLSHSAVYMRDFEGCLRMREQVRRYYTENFMEFCDMGGDVANIVRVSQRFNRYEIPLNCDNTQRFVYGKEMQYRIRAYDIPLAFFLYWPVLFLASLAKITRPLSRKAG
jgi:hypothetical protein